MLYSDRSSTILSLSIKYKNININNQSTELIRNKIRGVELLHGYILHLRYDRINNRRLFRICWICVKKKVTVDFPPVKKAIVLRNIRNVDIYLNVNLDECFWKVVYITGSVILAWTIWQTKDWRQQEKRFFVKKNILFNQTIFIEKKTIKSLSIQNSFYIL